MAREPYSLKEFYYGIIKRSDSKDIPEQAASDSNNIDGDAPEGKLQGIPDKAEFQTSTKGYDARLSAWIKTDDGKWNLVYSLQGGTEQLKVITDWYSAFTDSGIAVTTPAYSMVVHNQEAHIACGISKEPQFIGYVKYGQFGGAAAGWYNVFADLNIRSVTTGTIAISSVTANTGTLAFDETRTYQYTFSITMDYTQESPIDQSFVTAPAVASNTASYAVNILISNAANINKRITAVNIYRRDKNENAANSEYTLWRLVKTIDATIATGWSGTTNKAYTFTDTNTIQYGTYETNTGLPETLDYPALKYTLSCDLNGYHYIASGATALLPDATHMVFRSQPYRYDSFHWSKAGEYVKLPTLPLALVAFNHRVWVFDENRAYVINPDSMTIEQTLEGYGCLSQRSININHYGMFWCDTNNVYWHNGQEIVPIGDLTKAETGHWHGFPYNYSVGNQPLTPIVVFSSTKNYVIFIIPYSDGVTEANAWAWHAEKKRWDKWEEVLAPNTEGCGASAGAFVGRNGEVYLASGLISPTGKLYNLFGSANTKAWSWTSKNLTFGEIGRRKQIYTLSTYKSGTVTTYYSINEGTFIDQSVTGIARSNANRLRIKLDGASNASVEEVALSYRRLHLI